MLMLKCGFVQPLKGVASESEESEQEEEEEEEDEDEDEDEEDEGEDEDEKMDELVNILNHCITVFFYAHPTQLPLIVILYVYQLFSNHMKQQCFRATLQQNSK